VPGFGDTLVVTKLDRLARSLPDARAIAEELTARGVRFSVGGSVYDPNDTVGRLLFNVLAIMDVILSSPDDQDPDLGCNVADGVFDLAA
jgi:DNA invertase Pin-like site-specific DNA recombinase